MKLNLEGKKYLVTSGCSFTDGFHMGNQGSWAYYLSGLLNLELHNRAKGGAGNEWISNSIITYLQNNPNIRKECLIGVAWSDVSRLMHSFKLQENSSIVLDTIQPQDFLQFPLGSKFSKYPEVGEIFFPDIPYCVFKSYLVIQNLITYCERWDIPYFTIDAINPINVNFNISSDFYTIDILSWSGNFISFDLNEYPCEYKNVINQEWSQNILKNKLNINQYKTILHLMSSDTEKYEKGNPGHPNDIASKEVAESIYNQIV